MSGAAGLSNYEIRAEGWKALTERLGVSGLTLDDAIARAREKSGGGTP